MILYFFLFLLLLILFLVVQQKPKEGFIDVSTIAKQIEDYLESDNNKSKKRKKSKSKKDNTICLDSTNNLSNSIQFLVQQIDNLTLDNEVLKKKVNELYNDYQDNKDNIDNRNAEAKKVKEAFTKQLSKSASLLSGLSSSKASNMLSEHYNKTLTMDNFNSFLKSAEPPSVDDIKEKNSNIASNFDTFKKQIPKDNTESLKTSYLKSNMIKCDCGSKLQSGVPLGEVLIQLANDKGFNNMDDVLKGCNHDITCKNRKIKTGHKTSLDYLKSLSNIFGCELTNKKGMFPYNINQFNSNKK